MTGPVVTSVQPGRNALWDMVTGLGRSTLDAFYGPALGAVVAERFSSLPDRWKGTNEQIQGGGNATLKALRHQDLTAEERESIIGNPATGFGAADLGAVGGLPLLAGTYAGRNAATANLGRLKQAEDLLAAGRPAEEVRQTTGWFRDKAGDWKFEISDQGMRLRDPSEFLRPEVLELLKQGDGIAVRAGDLIEHPALFGAYPDIANYGLILNPGALGGSFHPNSKYISMGINRTRPTPNDPWTLGFLPEHRLTAIHELQHAVQNIENHARGGNPSMVAYHKAQIEDEISRLRGERRRRLLGEAGPNGNQDLQALTDRIVQLDTELSKFPFDDYQGYLRLLGEAEARDAEARLDFDQAERQRTPPYASTGLKPENLIVRKPGPEGERDLYYSVGGGADSPPKPKGKKSAPVQLPDFFDYGSLAQVPGVPQFDLERTVPPKGPSERVQALDTRSVIRKVNEGVDRGAKMGGIEWYNTEPLRRAFIDYLGPEEGQRRYGLYMDMVAATSPRSDVPTNVRNASYYYQQALKGEQPAKPLPKPYGHMAQNLHIQNFNNIMGAGGTMSPDGGFPILANPKPPSFSQNLQGNQRPITADTHYVRKFGMSANTPDWLLPSYKPEKDAGMVYPRQAVESGEVNIKKVPASWWDAVPRPNEYGFLEMLGQREAGKKGMSPAQFQASGWIGAGAETGLTSGGDPFLRHFENRLRITADRYGVSMQEALERVIDGDITLLSAPMPTLPPSDPNDVPPEVDPEARANQAAIAAWVGMGP